MVRARIEPQYDTVHARLLVMALALVQPLVRGWSRYFTWLHFKRTPRSVIRTHENLPEGRGLAINTRRRVYWNEEGKDRHHLLTSIFQRLEEDGWRYSSDTGWNEWDIQIYGNFWWSVVLQTVTEYHGGPKCLNRVRLRFKLVPTTVVVNLVLLSIVIYRQLNAPHLDLWSIVLYALFVIFLATRARALKRRVGELVDLAAYRGGMERIIRRGKKPAPAAEPVHADSPGTLS
jgi:hypothetical protein